MIGAHKNGIKCIGVRWGYAEENELEEYGADWIVSTIEELERYYLHKYTLYGCIFIRLRAQTMDVTLKAFKMHAEVFL